MHRRLERNGAGVIMEIVETEIAPGLRRKRPMWSAAEWESRSGIGRVPYRQETWTDGDRMAWTLRK